MHILFVSGREISYERNQVLLRALGRFAEVEAIAYPFPSRSLLASSLWLALRSVGRLATGPSFDLCLVGFYGYFIAQLLARTTRTPLLFDAFLSNYDTLCFDRREYAPNSWRGRLAYGLDRSTCDLAAGVILDTPRHSDYFVHTFQLSPHKLYTVPVGCNEDLFYPRPATKTTRLQVLTYSSYMPLHGMDTVVQAAALVKDLPLHFRLIGAGPELARVQHLAASLPVPNLEFVPPVDKETLAAEIAGAHICLGGHFGITAKAGRVVPGKLYQMLAMARPVIAGATPANQDLLRHGRDAWLVPPGDPIALANGLRTLFTDCGLRHNLAQTGRALFKRKASEAIIAKQLQRIVTAVAHGEQLLSAG